MSGTRSAFSLPLCGLLQGLIVLGYALRPSWYRPLVFVPISLIAYYLTFRSATGTAADVGLGSGITTQLLFAFNGIILTDVQKTLYRIGEQPGQITSAPFRTRFAWGWHLHNSPRGVRWGHEVAHISKNPPSLNPPQNKKAFMFSRISMICLFIGVQATFLVINTANPALAPGATPLYSQSIYIRVLSTLGLGIPGYAQINVLHYIMSVILVAVGISRPVDWPPLFGSPGAIYTVRGFWRKFWHQMLRGVLLNTTNFIIHTILRIPYTSAKSSPRIKLILGLLKLHTVFLVSALVHAAGEFMMLGYGGSGALYFFVLQAWAITLEMAIQYLVTGSTRPSNKPPALIWRLLGYAWVVSWFILVVPFMQQPMIEAGMFVTIPRSALTQKVTKLLALDVI
ncbi:hypothetical protein P691DRAFT_701161 [Macrolepiota fuliginosa MF-IS2]|uniref:Wax synthase domain-containing protein n=1 Tax=Macrolepiota fuliginosa MF-IS2 TaxID=1400762 RepID=A0A9P5XFG7_9AGAR|nr:hypothetical protein P691DRAFT_701161 [Macrolepiota fuliginosa MF-IS2]